MKQRMVEATFTEDKVKKYYAWRASNYDAGSSFEIGPHAEALKLADVQKGQHVLDVACGTGRGTVGLGQAVGPTGQVDAMDLSEAMLAQALTPRPGESDEATALDKSDLAPQRTTEG